MPTNLSINAAEQGTLVISGAFTDEDGAAVVPDADSIEWTLSDADGNVVEGCNGVEITPSASTFEVVLKGTDLKLFAGETAQKVERRFLIEATYTSDLGANLPLKEVGYFYINNFAAVV
jgi:hypothetical protein